MGQTPAQLAASKKYHREKLDEMKIYVAKGTKEQIQEHAKAQGESLNALPAAPLPRRWSVTLPPLSRTKHKEQRRSPY